MKVELTKSEIELIQYVLDEAGKTYDDIGTTVKSIKQKLSPKPSVKKVVKSKRYMFNFIGGGWNTIYGKTKRGAIKEALATYNRELKVDTNSFRLCSDTTYNQGLNMTL